MTLTHMISSALDCSPQLKIRQRGAIIGMYSPFNPSLTTNDVSIDNYRGEESDIVIASQTRFNDTNEVGFMNSPERLNVLISRA